VALGKAKQRVDLAESWCAKDKTRQANARLRQVAQQLAQYAQALRGLSARKRVGEEIRDPLAQAADGIQAEARALRRPLRCPKDTILFVKG
jgi:hypothetical protein